MLVNHTEQQVCHYFEKSFCATVQFKWCTAVRWLKVLWFDQGHPLSYQHPPSGAVGGVTLLSAADGLSSYPQSLLSAHIHTQCDSKVQQHTNTPTQARSQIYYTHINNLAAVTQREGLSDWGLWRSWGGKKRNREDEQRDKTRKTVKSANLTDISRLMQTAREFFYSPLLSVMNCGGKWCFDCVQAQNFCFFSWLLCGHFSDLCDSVWNTLCDKALAKCTKGKRPQYWSRAGWSNVLFYTHTKCCCHSGGRCVCWL